MKTLDQCQKEVAKRYDFKAFPMLIAAHINHLSTVLKLTDEAAELYASQFREPSSPDKIDEAISYFEEIKSERESKKEDDTVLINYVLIILKSIKQRSPTVKESHAGEQEELWDEVESWVNFEDRYLNSTELKKRFIIIRKQ